MKCSRETAQPSKDTFSMKPLLNLFYRYKHQEKPKLIVDPFAKDCKLADITNDINPKCDTDYHMDALEFLKMFESNTIDMILLDPPFSSRQVKEIYEKLGLTVTWKETQATFWTDVKKEISRVLKTGGICITCGWNSNGVGKKNGFQTEEFMSIAHGGMHNDTLVVVDRKVQGNLF